MNPDVKQKWIAELRSGEYTQGQEQLRYDGTYCCLGVLCDIYDPSGWTIFGEDPIDYLYVINVAGNDIEDKETLPPPVADWADLLNENPTVSVPCPHVDKPDQCKCENGIWQVDLGTLNDSGYSFQQIADVIDAQL